MNEDFWVYMIVEEEYEDILINETIDHYFKFGMTNSPFDRIKGLQTANPRKLKIERMYYYATRGMALSIEKRMHEILDEFHVSGEWFYLTKKSVQKIEECEPFLGKNLVTIQGENYRDIISSNMINEWANYNEFEEFIDG